jgi:hypothetical protein
MGAAHTKFMGLGQAMLLLHISYVIPCHWGHFTLQTKGGVISLLFTSKEEKRCLEYITKSKEGLLSHEVKW